MRVRSSIGEVAEHIQRFYATRLQSPTDVFVDFDVQVQPGLGLRRTLHRQCRFLLDDNESFFPLPFDQAAPMLEWGLNWCVASRPVGYLVMHAGVLAMGQRAIVMPGHPGAGKSTLCAALHLMKRWRLLSDELTILEPLSGTVLPHPRPICVKNESIDIVSGFPGASLGRIYRDTRKGAIAHVACDQDSISQGMVPAKVHWVVFPRFVQGGGRKVEEVSRAEAFALISEQSFNRERMGEVGFNALCSMLSDASCYQITYGSTQAALDAIDEVVG